MSDQPPSVTYLNLSGDQLIRRDAIHLAVLLEGRLPSAIYDHEVPDHADTADEAAAMNAGTRRYERATVDRVLRLADRFADYVRDGTNDYRCGSG